MTILRHVLLLCVAAFAALSIAVVSVAAQATTAAETATTTTAAASSAADEPDPSICAIPYAKMKNLQFVAGSASSSSSSGSSSSSQSGSSTTFLFSVSPCENTTILSPSGSFCGMGFAGWTELTPAHNSTCMYVYTRNLTSHKSSVTIYATSDYSETLVVNWDCTGLEGDLNPNQKMVTSVTGNRTRREVTIQTKGCQRPDTGELRAGVIVAICVVSIFVLVVILSVVKAKCFGGSGGAGSGAGASQSSATYNDGYTAAP
jgi:hypothetical protein